MNRRNGTAICLFGAYPVRVDGQPHRLGMSGATERLFQYLLVNAGRESRREYLADLFWRRSSAARQRSALNSAIWRIKRQIREVPGLELFCDGPAVFLHIDASVPVDACRLTDIVRSIAPGDALDDGLAERLYLALNDCEAPFMDGVTADWVLTERERLFNVQIRGLTILMHWLGQKRRYEDALEIGRRLLAADPARESAQCEVMWLYVLNGQRAQAIRQYHWFRNWLKRELDIEPMAETKALYDHIRQELDAARPGHAGRAAAPDEVEARKASFNRLLGAIERSRRDLYEVLSNQPT
jgi:DNA-binding SARP family transcriptional activator